MAVGDWLKTSDGGIPFVDLGTV